MRKKILAVAGVLFVIAILQSTLMEYIEVFSIKPNLFLVFTVAVALQRGSIESSVTGLMMGLGYDMLIGKALGWYALLGFLTGYLISIANEKLYRDNIIVLTLFTFAATCFVEISFYIMTFLLRGYKDILYILSSIVLPEGIYNSLLAILVYPAVTNIYERLDRHNRTHTRL